MVILFQNASESPSRHHHWQINKYSGHYFLPSNRQQPHEKTNALAAMTKRRDSITISDILIEWEQKNGTCSFAKLPAAMMWIDTTLAGLMAGVQAMVGTERFLLALQSQGRKSVEADWQIISKYQDFRQGFAAIAQIAAVAGWGRWEIVSLDFEQQQCVFQVSNSWEGLYQKSLGVCWGSAMLAGKLSGYCSKLFGTNCWAEQSTFTALDDAVDTFMVKPSRKTVEAEIENLLQSDEATRADMAVALQKLQNEVDARVIAENELRIAQQKLETKVDKRTRELLESEDKFKSLFEQAGDYVLVLELNQAKDLIIIDANQSACNEHGYAYHELIGQSLSILDRKFQIPVPEKTLEKLFTGETLQFEVMHTRKDNTTFPVEVSSKAIAVRGKTYFFSIERNITERKQIEKRLVRSEALYRSLIETTSVVAWEVDLATMKFNYISPHVENMLGYPASAWQDVAFWASHIHPDDRDEAVSFCQAETALGHDHQFEYRYITADGEMVWLRDIVSIVSVKDQPVALRGFFHDITENKRREEEMQRLKNLESIGTLAAGIAHDFNNLMMAILGNIELASMQIDPKSGAVGNLDESKEALQRATKLTQQLLTFAKGGTPVRSNVYLTTLINETAALVFSGSNIKISPCLDQSTWPMSIDRNQIIQVLHNLLVNAKDAMPEGGEVIIRAGNYQQKEKSPSLDCGDYVKLQITDGGRGIADSIKNKIFDPYFTTKGRGGERGTGLGLAICHSIIKNHHGYISIDSNQSGTTVSLYLPADSDAVAQTVTDDSLSTPKTPPKHPQQNCKILVLEDEEAISRVVADMLSKLQYEAVIVSDGREAVIAYEEALAEGVPFQAVLLDLTIRNGLGGEATIKELHKVDPQVKAVVASGYADHPILADFLNYGFKAALAKPYSLNSLKQALNAL